MKGIMFNTKYGLEQVVLNGTKTRTWRADKEPRYKIGEIVAIKQCYKDVMNYSFYNDKKLYDKVCNLMNEVGATNKMFVKNELMPHKIKITKVTPCKLQDVTEEECLREGIHVFIKSMFNFDNSGLPWYDSAKEAFADLINKLNGKGYWEGNPDGYAYEFELVNQIIMKYKLTLTTHQFMLCDMCIKNSYDFLRHIQLSASNLPNLDNKKEIIKLLSELKPIVEDKGWAYTIQDREFMYDHLVHQDAINHIAYCEFTEQELYEVSRCVEDWHRFVAGQIELDNTTSVCKDRRDLHDNMRYLHDLVMNDDYYYIYDTYGWNGNHCKNKEQRKFICETYPLYRDILVYFTRRKNTYEWSVYNSDTLRCELSGEPIKIEKL